MLLLRLGAAPRAGSSRDEEPVAAEVVASGLRCAGCAAPDDPPPSSPLNSPSSALTAYEKAAAEGTPWLLHALSEEPPAWPLFEGRICMAPAAFVGSGKLAGLLRARLLRGLHAAGATTAAAVPADLAAASYTISSPSMVWPQQVAGV